VGPAGKCSSWRDKRVMLVEINFDTAARNVPEWQELQVA
jgi:hypothetical protein